jgi:hypothetical protein
MSITYDCDKNRFFECIFCFFVLFFFCLCCLLVFFFLAATISFGWLEGWSAPLGPCSGSCLRKKEGYFCDKNGGSFSVSRIAHKGN